MEFDGERCFSVIWSITSLGTLIFLFFHISHISFFFSFFPFPLSWVSSGSEFLVQQKKKAEDVFTTPRNETIRKKYRKKKKKKQKKIERQWWTSYPVFTMKQVALVLISFVIVWFLFPLFPLFFCLLLSPDQHISVWAFHFGFIAGLPLIISCFFAFIYILCDYFLPPFASCLFRSHLVSVLFHVISFAWPPFFYFCCAGHNSCIS